MHLEQDIFAKFNSKEELAFQETQKPLLKNQFSINNMPVFLMLKDPYIVLA